MNDETNENGSAGAAVADVTPQRASAAAPRRRRCSDEVLAKALREAGGWISAAAKAVGMKPSAVSMRIARNPALKEVVDDVRETQLDMVENALMLNIQENRDQRAIEFYLKCRGRARGWIEQTQSEVTVKPSVAQKFTRAELLDMAGVVEAPKP